MLMYENDSLKQNIFFNFSSKAPHGNHCPSLKAIDLIHLVISII